VIEGTLSSTSKVICATKGNHLIQCVQSGFFECYFPSITPVPRKWK